MGAGERTQTELPVTMLSLTCIDALFEAVIECTAEAILNAMLKAETMTGRDDMTLHALDGEVLAERAAELSPPLGQPGGAVGPAPSIIGCRRPGPVPRSRTRARRTTPLLLGPHHHFV